MGPQVKCVAGHSQPPKKRKNKKEASPLPYDPPTHQIKKERQQQEQKTTSLWTPSSGWFLLNLF